MQTSRRVFLGASVGAQAMKGFAMPSPNDRIQIGLIGAGGRGTYLMQEVVKAKGANAAITAVCDVYRPNLETAAARIEKAFGAPPKKTSDFRELLASKDIDAVIISAPDFAHSDILERAVAAGKDAYCEKPMGVQLDEARRAYLAVKRSDRVVQIGTQRRSEPGLIGAAKLMRSGVIGKVTRVDMEVHFQEPRWRRDWEHIRKEDIDWPNFVFNRPNRPFDARRFREWQLFSDFTNGIPGLWMSHFIDLVPWFLDDPYPRSAVASGGVYLWKDGRETSDVFQSLLEYPKDCQVSFAMSLTNAGTSRNLWFGTRGTLDADALRITGAGSRQPDRLTQEVAIPKEPVDSHMENFLSCLRSRQTPRADIQAGFSHAVAGCVAAEALRTGRRMGFDPQRLELV